MDRKELRKSLLAVPGSIGGGAAIASVWQTPRDWIGGSFAALASAMTHPWVTVLVTLMLVAYLGAVLWTFIKPRVPSVAETHEVEAERERRSRRRKMLNEAREMVVNHELQSRWNWRQTTRYSHQFADIRPHLSEAYMKRLNAVRTIELGQAGTSEPLVQGFLDELDRLERDWKLS